MIISNRQVYNLGTNEHKFKFRTKHSIIKFNMCSADVVFTDLLCLVNKLQK